jgi:iron complex outermembrane receptor protein
VPTVAEGGISNFINPCDASLGLTLGVDTPLNPGLCNGPISSKSRNFDQFQPKVSAKWDAFEETTLYASWGVGFRSGGFNNQGSQATVDTFINNVLLDAAGNNGLCDPSVAGCVASGRSRVGVRDDYAKETSSTFEVGFKSNWLDNALQVEGAAYYNQVDDMQFFEFIVGPFGLLRVVENIDEVEIKGVELGVTWDAAEWLDLYAGVNFNDTEIKKNSVRPDTVGNDSPYTPDYTGNLGAYFSWPIGNSLNFFTNLDVSTVGDTWFHVVQDQTRPIGFEAAAIGAPISPGEYSVARRDGYTLANLRIGIEGENWTAALWATNLTDEEFLEEVIPAPEFGGSFISPGTLRRIGGDFTWRF